MINGYSYTTNTYAQTQLWAVGSQPAGQLGQNIVGHRSSPVQISGSIWGKIGSVYESIWAIKQDGTLWGWGSNPSGSLGLNDRISRSSPMQVGTDTTWNYVSKGGSIRGRFATKTDGTLWAWGTNSTGMLGLNQAPAQQSAFSSPTQVGTDTTWPQDGNSLIATGYITSFAIKTNGTLWSWGDNENGALGHNSAEGVNRSSPTQIGTDTTWKSVRPLFYGGIANKTDGTLWSWGQSTTGITGHNANVSLSSPTQIGTDTTWSILDGGGGGRYALTMSAIKTDGTLWTWGSNEYGLLGQNQGHDVEHRSSPIQVGTDTNWAYSNMARYNALATKTDGTLWAWGYNQTGMFGQNTSSPVGNVSSPTQVMSGKNYVRLNGTVMDSTSMTVGNTTLLYIIKEP